jgi:AcrR family transcriptional regulator
MSMAAETQRRTGGKRERTRAALIAATLDVVAVKGFAGASLDAIATRAGMTRGAIYSNFAGRGELLLAAMGAKGLTLSPVYAPGAPLRVQLRAMADALVEALPRAHGEAKFLA